MVERMTLIVTVCLSALCLLGCVKETHYAGVCKVGVDIQAGSYVPTEEDGSSDAYVAVYTDEIEVDNYYSSSSKSAIDKYCSVNIPNTDLMIEVTNTDGTVEVENLPAG